jgi:hypothetical protein
MTHTSYFVHLTVFGRTERSIAVGRVGWPSTSGAAGLCGTVHAVATWWKNKYFK